MNQNFNQNFNQNGNQFTQAPSNQNNTAFNQGTNSFAPPMNQNTNSFAPPTPQNTNSYNSQNQSQSNQKKEWTKEDSENYQKSQIYRADGRNRFIEIMDSAFEIEKVVFNAIEYNDKMAQGSRIKQKLTFYLNFDDALLLIHQYKTGMLSYKAQQSLLQKKNTGSKYASDVFDKLGGTRAGSPSNKRTDGKPVSRRFKIQPGDKQPWVILMSEGAGETMKTGLIKPVGRPDSNIFVPLSDDDFGKMLLMLEMRIQNFLQAKYITTYSKRLKEHEMKKQNYQ